MEEKKVTNDVLHFENHSKLSAADIEKAVKHHNRDHKGDAQEARKAAAQAKAPAKRR